MVRPLTNPARRWNPLWLLLAVPLAAVCGGLGVYLVVPGHTDPSKAAPKNNKETAKPDLGLFATVTAAEPPERQKNEQDSAKVQQWEYKVVALDPIALAAAPANTGNGIYPKTAVALTDEFNKLAQDGWQYHSTVNGANSNVHGQYVLFQRPKR